MASGELSEPEFTAFLTTACRLMAEATCDGALHYVRMDWRHVFALMAAGRVAYDELINFCVWSKPAPGMGSLYRSAHELVLVFKHGRGAPPEQRPARQVWAEPQQRMVSPRLEGFLRSSEDGDLTSQHPTPKPFPLIADAIMDASVRGDVVLDPFGGSGSTLIACERVGRQARLMELDPLYVDLAMCANLDIEPRSARR